MNGIKLDEERVGRRGLRRRGRSAAAGVFALGALALGATALGATALGAAALSCSLAAAELSVVVELPEFPAGWSGAECWELSDDGGSLWISAPAEGRIVVGLPRSQAAFILARARFGSGRTEAYGAVWPQDAVDEGPAPVLRLRAGGGWAAAVGIALAGAGCDPGGFNLARLGREVEASLADPWRLDPYAAARAMVGGGFRADYLREPALRYQVLAGLPLALYGRVLSSASPRGEALAVDGEGRASAWLGAVPARWLGLGYELSAGLSPDGEAVWAARSTGR